MKTFEQLAWESGPLVVAVTCWTIAIALTLVMGWNAWTGVRDLHPRARQAEAVLLVDDTPHIDALSDHKKRVVR